MKRIILFMVFLTSLCVHSFGKDKFESPNHQLSAEVNGQSVTLYDKSKQMVTRIHLGLITDQGNLDSCLVLKQSTAVKTVKADYTMITGKRSHCTNRRMGRHQTPRRLSRQECRCCSPFRENLVRCRN